ncbi:MAG TPA: dephospho-CoA kinase [Clostridia bacterium]|nr:dephospho-CoA kinase [Clostridia bacterium]
MNMPAIFIGITGGSGSGKTTFCALLAKNFSDYKVKVIHIDSYYHKDVKKTKAPYTQNVYHDYIHPGSIDFKRLLKDLNLFKKSNNFDIVIVEGLLIFHTEEMRNLFDLKIYIDVEADERLARIFRRNMKMGMAFGDISDYYLESARYRHNEYIEPSRWHADIVINGTRFSNTAVNMIHKWVESCICEQRINTFTNIDLENADCP